MFEVKVQGGFSAAHKLRGYQGDCEHLHGHNWMVELSVAGERGGDGMVVDFRVLKEALRKVLDPLDHKYLNELDYFKERNTTSENIAEYLFGEVSSTLPEGVRVSCVTVWESPNCGVTYREK